MSWGWRDEKHVRCLNSSSLPSVKRATQGRAWTLSVPGSMRTKIRGNGKGRQRKVYHKQHHIQRAKGWSTTRNNTYSELKGWSTTSSITYSELKAGLPHAAIHTANYSRNRQICREVVKCALVRDFDGDSWSSVLSVPVCVCVCVLRQKRKDGKFRVTHTYSGTLCDTNTPYWHGHGRMNYLTTTALPVTIPTQQTA
jgi:hypothetical protein